LNTPSRGYGINFHRGSHVAVRCAASRSALFRLAMCRSCPRIKTDLTMRGGAAALTAERAYEDWIASCARLTNLTLGDEEKTRQLARETHKCLVAKTFAPDSLALSVPPVVDAVWHNMILDTVTYGEYCATQLKVFLHHTPFSAADADEVKNKRVAKTAAFYANVYGAAYGADVEWIWESPAFAAPSQQKKRKVSKAAVAKAKEASRTRSLDYTFNGANFSVHVADAMPFGDVLPLLSRRHGGVDVTFLSRLSDRCRVEAGNKYPNLKLFPMAMTVTVLSRLGKRVAIDVTQGEHHSSPQGPCRDNRRHPH
jgi:hypothetical protein